MIDSKFLSILIEKKEYIESLISNLSYVYSKDMQVSNVDGTKCLPEYDFGTELFYNLKTPFNITITLQSNNKTKKYCKELKNNNIHFFTIFKNTIYISCKLYEFSCLQKLYDITCNYKSCISHMLVYTDIQFSSKYYLYKVLLPKYNDTLTFLPSLKYYIFINENRVLTLSEYEITLSSVINNIANTSRYETLTKNKEMFTTLFNTLSKG